MGRAWRRGPGSLCVGPWCRPAAAGAVLGLPVPTRPGARSVRLVAAAPRGVRRARDGVGRRAALAISGLPGRFSLGSGEPPSQIAREIPRLIRVL